jgi:hypothetical protein
VPVKKGNMSMMPRVLDREGMRHEYYLVRGGGTNDPLLGYWKAGRLNIRVNAVGRNPLIQDVAAFEKLLERKTPKYYAQLEAFRLAGKLGILDQYFKVSEKRPYSERIFCLAKLESTR